MTTMVVVVVLTKVAKNQVQPSPSMRGFFFDFAWISFLQVQISGRFFSFVQTLLPSPPVSPENNTHCNNKIRLSWKTILITF